MSGCWTRIPNKYRSGNSLCSQAGLPHNSVSANLYIRSRLYYNIFSYSATGVHMSCRWFRPLRGFRCKNSLPISSVRMFAKAISECRLNYCRMKILKNILWTVWSVSTCIAGAFQDDYRTQHSLLSETDLPFFYIRSLTEELSAAWDSSAFHQYLSLWTENQTALWQALLKTQSLWTYMVFHRFYTDVHRSGV